MTDDSGVFTDGTAVNKAFIDQLYDVIDDQAHSASNPSIKPKTITDEVVNARGSKLTLDTRLDVSLNEDGTLKTIAGQVTQTELGKAEGQYQLVSNGDMEFWDNGAALAARGWVLAGAGATVARTGPSEADTQTVNAGPYASKVTQAGGVAATYTNSVIPATIFARMVNIRSRKVAVLAQVIASVVSKVRIIVDDGVTTTASSYHPGDNSLWPLTVLHTLSASATKLDVYLEIAAGGTAAYLGGVSAIISDTNLGNWLPDATRRARVERFGSNADVSNGTTVETDLTSWSIPPIDNIGEGFTVWFSGSLAANVNLKTLRLDIAGQKLTIFTSNTNVVSNVFTGWLRVVRRTTAIVGVYGMVSFNAATGAVPTVWHIATTIGSLDMTRTQTCKFTGQSDTASADIALRPISGVIDRA